MTSREAGASQSLFAFPLGPGGAKGFDHDGGETIYSLPNGFQAYYLNDKTGKYLDKGPTQIVRDIENPRDPAVTNGISCMRCHDQGMRYYTDKIRDAIVQNKTISKQDRETVEALYPPNPELKLVIDADMKRFLDAMVRAGLDPKLKLNGVEIIFALSQAYEAAVDAEQVASELGFKKDEFLKATGDVETKYRTMMKRFTQGGTVPRDEFEVEYIELAKAMADEEPIRGGVKRCCDPDRRKERPGADLRQGQLQGGRYSGVHGQGAEGLLPDGHQRRRQGRRAPCCSRTSSPRTTSSRARSKSHLAGTN